MLSNETIAKSKLPSLSELEGAAELVSRYVPATPQFRWPLLGSAAGCELWIKHENHRPAGSFKMRGGLVYMAPTRALLEEMEMRVSFAVHSDGRGW